MEERSEQYAGQSCRPTVLGRLAEDRFEGGACVTAWRETTRNRWGRNGRPLRSIPVKDYWTGRK